MEAGKGNMSKSLLPSSKREILHSKISNPFIKINLDRKHPGSSQVNKASVDLADSLSLVVIVTELVTDRL